MQSNTSMNFGTRQINNTLSPFLKRITTQTKKMTCKDLNDLWQIINKTTYNK